LVFVRPGNKKDVIEIHLRADGEVLAYCGKKDMVEGYLGWREKIITQSEWKRLRIGR
jgi:hypothetical protein